MITGWRAQKRSTGGGHHLGGGGARVGQPHPGQHPASSSGSAGAPEVLGAVVRVVMGVPAGNGDQPLMDHRPLQRLFAVELILCGAGRSR
jgi:hypothetical protein